MIRGMIGNVRIKKVGDKNAQKEMNVLFLIILNNNICKYFLEQQLLECQVAKRASQMPQKRMDDKFTKKLY